MKNNSNNNEMIKTMMDFEISPIEIEKANLAKHTKLPISEIATLGVLFEPLVAGLQNVTGGSAKSGLYRVNFPKGVSG